MNNSKLSNIYEKNNLNEIKVWELQYNNIDIHHIDFVNKFIKNKNKNFIIQFISMLFFFSLVLFIFYVDLKINGKPLFKELIFMLVFLLSFIFILIHISKQIYYTSNFKYKKAQYGLIKTKYSLKGDSTKKSRKYYINVMFPDTNTYIIRVVCSYKIYNSLNEGDNILVISFNNKIAYAVPVNNKTSNW